MLEPIITRERDTLPSDTFFVDAFQPQLRELFFIENHQFIGRDKGEAYASTEFANFEKKMHDSFVYVYFPWNKYTIKTVGKKDYLTLKTNRNQDLITESEQDILSKFSIAVLGLSVGSNIAFALTQAGISNKIVLADYDDLDTTNLNRILAGVHQVGMNKCEVAGSRIYEGNPFAEIKMLQDGITVNNLEELLKKGEINCIVEEIDDMHMKISTRKLAMLYKVPVVMITDNGDGVVLHVERYDLGLSQIFGHDIAYWSWEDEHEFTKEEAGIIIIGDIVGGPEKVDPKMMKSVERVIKKELVSWSQLGSSALLGGVVATAAIKGIALGEATDLFSRTYVHPLNVKYG